ncbi:hypothetical protein F5Y12DRAFT_728314 [Xylaria sp. FL1777]|nr:hypothetical protein F5Y12DRAFT_728314 [Xylaria sp. FL1777]
MTRAVILTSLPFVLPRYAFGRIKRPMLAALMWLSGMRSANDGLLKILFTRTTLSHKYIIQHIDFQLLSLFGLTILACF